MASAAGALAGLAGVTLVRLARLIVLMPLDWVLGAWLGAATLGLAAALRRIKELRTQLEAQLRRPVGE